MIIAEKLLPDGDRFANCCLGLVPPSGVVQQDTQSIQCPGDIVVDIAEPLSANRQA